MDKRKVFLGIIGVGVGLAYFIKKEKNSSSEQGKFEGIIDKGIEKMSNSKRILKDGTYFGNAIVGKPTFDNPINKKEENSFFNAEHVETEMKDLENKELVSETKQTKEQKTICELSFFETGDMYFEKEYNYLKFKGEKRTIIINVSITATPRHISILKEDTINTINLIRKIINKMDLEILDSFKGRKNAIKKIKEQLELQNYMFKEVYFKRFAIRENDKQKLLKYKTKENKVENNENKNLV